MARLPRFALPGYTQHVIVRGINRQTIFRTHSDYTDYLGSLFEVSKRYACAVHAYVLMPNHAHLLITPATHDGISKLMQVQGRLYVQHFNQKYRRTGTLWEGRYRATLVDPEVYLLDCSQYIELNPVRAALVSNPANYAYSSFQHNAGGTYDALITPHPSYLALGKSALQRRKQYLQRCLSPLDESRLQEIRAASHHCWVLGQATFKEQVAKHVKRPVIPRPRGGDRRSAAFQKAQYSLP